MTKESIKDIYVGETLFVGDCGEFVTVHFIDEESGKVYCADEMFGIASWYDIEMLEKVSESEYEFANEENRDDNFMAFVEALRAAGQMAGYEIPQVEISDEPNVLLDEFSPNEHCKYDDFYEEDNYEDLDDDLLDERYDGNRSPWYKFNFYNALEELKFQHENEDGNAIWYITNGERALTFKDDRLVDVRLADYIDNLVYFSAPIQLKDLNDEWEVHSIDDEETQKINEIVELIQLLHDDELAQDLLYTIKKYRE